MGFRFYDAESAIRVSPKQSYYEDFYAISEMTFDNAPNFFSKEDVDAIEYEILYGAKIFQKVDARVDAVINPGTQTNLGDDFKTFIFRQDFPRPYVGEMFKWKDSYWIAINTNNFESIPISCVARRCNNVLRWIDENGAIIEEPCIIAYEIWEGTNYSNQNLTLTAGYIKLFCQKNALTNTIKPNQRFIFGNKQRRECYKVHGNGIRNFLNQETFNDESYSFLEFTLAADYVNKTTDNLEYGIADFYKSDFNIYLNISEITQPIGFTTQILATVKNFDEEVYPDLVWESSNPEIASVDEDGNVELISNGECSIFCYLYDNKYVRSEVKVTVTESQESEFYEVVVSPYVTDILEGETQMYSCELYKNGEKQDSTFEFTYAGNVPEENFEFKVFENNSFSLTNKKKYLDSPVEIICMSGENVGSINVLLKGAW